jgi:chaperonin cofactor prefoldin
MEINEALLKLEAHEKECSLRYESIQRQLDEHNKRFDKLDAALNRQLVIMIGVIPVIIGFVEYLR